MKLLTWICLTTAMLIGASSAWSLDSFDEEYYWFYAGNQALSDAQLNSIWQQQLTPHEAAQILRLAGNFTHRSAAFAPFLHNLYYRLGQLTFSKEAQWSPETMQVCIKLARYIALFRTAYEFKTLPGVRVLLTAWQGNSGVPENDCTVLNAVNLTTAAVYTANPGSTLQCTLIALPLRPLQNVSLKAGLNRIQPSVSTSFLPIECRVEKVVYSLEDGKWQYKLQPVDEASSLDSGMQVYRLSLYFPENAIYGKYEFSVTVSTQYDSEVAKLNFQVNLEEGAADDL